MNKEEYEGQAQKFLNDIIELCKNNPEIKKKIMEMKDAWGFFEIPELYVSDRGLTAAQAIGVFARIKSIISK
jgi:hypothetical protein